MIRSAVCLPVGILSSPLIITVTDRPRWRKDLDGTENLSEVLKELEVPTARPVLFVVGSADNFDERITDHVRRLLQTVIAPVCASTNAVVLSGGTDAGVMALLGKAMTEFA